MESATQHLQRDLAHDPNRWVRRPFLPLFRPSATGDELALLVEGHGWSVYMVNLMDAILQLDRSSDRVTSPEFERWLKTLTSRTFATFDDLFADGWQVD